MVWFNVDDGFSNSKPVMRIPRRWRAACIGVWTLCGSWSAKELTDGHVPNEVLEEYGASPKIIELLIDSTLWERTEDGVNFRNWAKWQKTKQQVLDYRQAEADRKRNRRKAKTQTTDQYELEVSAPCPTGTPNGLHPESQRESAIPKPIPKPEPNQYLSEETLGGDLSTVAAVDSPAPFCPKHMPDGTDAPCRGCGAAREARERWDQQQLASEANRRAAVRRQITDCPDCDEKGWVPSINGVVRCPNHDWEAITHA